MNDKAETNEQVMDALVKMRKRIAELEASETEAKRVEQALRQSEQQYRNTLDNMIEGCQIIGSDWRYLYVNDAMARHDGSAREKLLGKTMMEVHPGIEKTEMFSTLRQCMEKRVSAAMEKEFTYPDGNKGLVELRIEPVPDGLFILSLDTNGRKPATQGILHLNETLLLIRRINQLTLQVDSQLESLLKACNQLVGLTGESVSPGEPSK